MHIRRAILLILSLFLATAALADSESERAALSRMIDELDRLEVLVAEAESKANPDARIRLRYDWLREDLARVRRGIESHVNAARSEPRSIPPLRGDYRR